MNCKVKERVQNSRPYEVNYTEEAEDETSAGADTILFSEAGELTDQAIEVFAAENDEDAQIIMQLEENLINLLQEDDEMAVLMTTYVEARKRLSEKSRYRGFWSTRGGKGGNSGPLRANPKVVVRDQNL